MDHEVNNIFMVLFKIKAKNQDYLLTPKLKQLQEDIKTEQ